MDHNNIAFQSQAHINVQSKIVGFLTFPVLYET